MNAKKLICVAVLLTGILSGCGRSNQTKKPKTQHTAVKRTASSQNINKYMRHPISYLKSSETKPYPKHLDAKINKIVVSTEKQRAYLMKNNHIIYTFYVSTGKNTKGMQTPKGVYKINNYRSNWFYSPQEHEGAKDAVGWKGQLYLFHETPSNQHKQIIKPVAKDLGKKGSSYGCVHLSVSDSNWAYHHFPTNMKVIIK